MTAIKLIRKRFRDCIQLEPEINTKEKIECQNLLELHLWQVIENYNKTKNKVGNCSKPKFEETGLLLCCVIEGDLL